MAEYEGDDLDDHPSDEGSLGPKTSLESEGSLGRDDPYMDHPLPTATGSGRKSSGRGSGTIESGRRSGEIGSRRGSRERGSRRGSRERGSKRGSREIESGRGSGTLETGRGSGSLESGQDSGEIKIRVGSGRMQTGRRSGIGIRVGSGRMETGRRSGQIDPLMNVDRPRSLRNVMPRQRSQVRGPFAPGPPTRGPSQRGPLTPGPPKRGPSQRGPLKRGPSQRGPLAPGPPKRAPSQRGPPTPGPPKRAPSQRGPPTPGPPKPGPPKKKSFLDVLKGSKLNIFKKSKTSKLDVPGQAKPKQSLLAKITKSATSFMSMLSFKKKPPPKPQLPPLRPRPPKRPPRSPSKALSRPRSSSRSRPQSRSHLRVPSGSKTPSETPPGSLDRPPSERSLPQSREDSRHKTESERVLKVTELGRFPSEGSAPLSQEGELEVSPSEMLPEGAEQEGEELEPLPPKRISQMLTKSVMEKIADEVSKLAKARRSVDSLTGRCRRGGLFGLGAKPAGHGTSNLCDRCLQGPPVATAILAPPVAFQPMEFAGPLCTAPYPRRGVMDLVRQFECPMAAFTTAVAAIPVPVAPPPLLPSSPSQALFSVPPQIFPGTHFPTSPFSQFSPYTSGAMPPGFHPGMGPLSSPYPFAAQYRSSGSWPRSSWLSPPFGMSFPPHPMPMHGFPKSPCEISPGLCQSSVPICPCGCGRPLAATSFYR